MEQTANNRKGSFWSKTTVILLAAVILLLIAGAWPRTGTPDLYAEHNGLLMVLGAVIGILSLYASCVFRWKNPAMFLLHIGGALILLGAYIDHFKEQKVSFATYVGDQYILNDLYDERTQISVPLDFAYSIDNFDVSYYPPTYSLYDRNTETKLEDGTLEDENIVFRKNGRTVPLNRLTRIEGIRFPFHMIDDRLIAVQNQPMESYYRADFTIRDGEQKETRELAVNQPVSYKGWKFYLMSHGSMGSNQYVYLTARNAPGAIWVKAGIWALIIGAFWFAFAPRRKRKEAT